jgi:hypothetical protein
VAVRAAVDAALVRAPWALSDDALTSAIAVVHAPGTKVSVLLAGLVAKASGLGLPAKDGATSPAVWLRGRLHISARAGAAVADLGAQLGASDAVRAALLAGSLNVEQAGVIRSSLDALPHDLDPDLRVACEVSLLAAACTLDATQLRRAGARVLEHVAPAIGEAALAAKLERDELLATQNRYLSLQRDGARVRQRRADALRDVCALSLVSGELPDRGGIRPQVTVTVAYEPLRGLIERLRARASRPGHDGSGHDGCGVGEQGHRGPGVSGQGRGGPGLSGQGRGGPGVDGHGHGRPGLSGQGHSGSGVGGQGGGGLGVGNQSRGGPGASNQGGGGLASGDVARAAGTCPVCANPVDAGILDLGSPDLDSLAGGRLGIGYLDNGDALSPEAVRRIACDARIIPTILDGDGAILDMGRGRRLWTYAARAAVIQRDGGCAFPGSDRLPQWCEVHHRISWLRGGRTDLDNGVLLCAAHHRLIHDERWMVRTSFDLVGSCDPM